MDDNVDRVQNCCFIILEDVCRDVFKGFFETEELPERKIIINQCATYHGMAVTHKKRQSKLNKKGLTIRYDIGKIFLKSEVFRSEGYYDALSTYVHEMCHMFGGDASVSFSQALTFATELLLENHEGVTKGKIKWNQAFATDSGLEDESMLIDFNTAKEITVPGMNNGTGMMTAKMYMDAQGKITPCTIHKGGSIGVHRHETSDDINYVLSGSGKATCDGEEEILRPGTCHICKKGSEHSIENTGDEDLVLLTVVVEH